MTEAKEGRSRMRNGKLTLALGLLLADQPELKQRLAREKIAGGDFLTMQLDGSLIPWEPIAEGAGVDISQIRDAVNKKELSLAIGVRDRYLLVSLGDRAADGIARGAFDITLPASGTEAARPRRDRTPV